MADKIKFFRVLIFIIISVLMIVLSLNFTGNVETDLLKTFLSKNIPNASKIIKIANNNSSVVKIVYEADDENELYNLKEQFLKRIDKKYFDTDSIEISGVLSQYLQAPANFISKDNRKLLQNEKYEQVYNKSINNLYNPAGITLGEFDKDPFMLFDDFLSSINNFTKPISYYNGKYYDYSLLKIRGKEGLSPNLTNKKIKELIKIQQNLSSNDCKIYLAGSPVHSYYSSKNAIRNINLICILSVLLISSLTYFYFKDLKILCLVFLCITFGMSGGYCATRLWFSDFQIITMVFSTMIIGIGIDYSYHYFFSSEHNNILVKNLLCGFLTTVIPFILLYLTKIELLQQIAVFSSFGLLCILSFVIFLYPCFKFPKAQKSVNINANIYKIFSIVILIISLSGFIKFNFDDSLATIYNPSKEILKAENLYNKISGEDSLNTQIIVVSGRNLNEIISKEENITKEFLKNNINYLSLSKLFPSTKVQKENFTLVKKLYDEELNNYNMILSPEQIYKLKTQKFKPVYFDYKKLSLIKEFMIDNNTSLVFFKTNKNFKMDGEIINIKSDIENFMRTYRLILLKIIPIVLFVIFIILTIIYGFRKGIKIMIPSMAGIISSAGFSLLIFGELNLFSLISLFLIFGFTIDYSIFRLNKHCQTEDAVLMSCITTSFSFLLLSFCGFKLISSMSVMLFIGMITAYLTGYLIFNNNEQISDTIKE